MPGTDEHSSSEGGDVGGAPDAAQLATALALAMQEAAPLKEPKVTTVDVASQQSYARWEWGFKRALTTLKSATAVRPLFERVEDTEVPDQEVSDGLSPLEERLNEGVFEAVIRAVTAHSDKTLLRKLELVPIGDGLRAWRLLRKQAGTSCQLAKKEALQSLIQNNLGGDAQASVIRAFVTNFKSYALTAEIHDDLATELLEARVRKVKLLEPVLAAYGQRPDKERTYQNLVDVLELHVLRAVRRETAEQTTKDNPKKDDRRGLAAATTERFQGFCFSCGKQGHRQVDCWWAAQGGKEQGKGFEQFKGGQPKGAWKGGGKNPKGKGKGKGKFGKGKGKGKDKGKNGSRFGGASTVGPSDSVSQTAAGTVDWWSCESAPAWPSEDWNAASQWDDGSQWGASAQWDDSGGWWDDWSTPGWPDPQTAASTVALGETQMLPVPEPTPVAQPDMGSVLAAYLAERLQERKKKEAKPTQTGTGAVICQVAAATTHDQRIWIVDSAASRHVVPVMSTGPSASAADEGDLEDLRASSFATSGGPRASSGATMMASPLGNEDAAIPCAVLQDSPYLFSVGTYLSRDENEDVVFVQSGKRSGFVRMPHSDMSNLEFLAECTIANGVPYLAPAEAGIPADRLLEEAMQKDTAEYDDLESVFGEWVDMLDELFDEDGDYDDDSEPQSGGLAEMQPDGEPQSGGLAEMQPGDEATAQAYGSPLVEPEALVEKEPDASDTHALTHRGCGTSCEACLTGKTREPQHRRIKVTFEDVEPNSVEGIENMSTQTTGPNEHRWAFDTVGPTSIAGVGGEKFLSVGLHDHSGYISVEPKKDCKSLTEAKCFERLFRGPIPVPRPTTIRVDGGPEFQKEFVERAEAIAPGLRWERTVPRCSQANARTERCNGEVLKMTRASLAQAGADSRLFPLAARMSVHNHNFCQVDPTTGYTPAEKLFGKGSRSAKRTGTHPFGVECWARVTTKERHGDKFGGTAVHSLLVGYSRTAPTGYLVVSLEDVAAGRWKTRIVPGLRFRAGAYVYPLKTDALPEVLTLEAEDDDPDEQTMIGAGGGAIGPDDSPDGGAPPGGLAEMQPMLVDDIGLAEMQPLFDDVGEALDQLALDVAELDEPNDHDGADGGAELFDFAEDIAEAVEELADVIFDEPHVEVEQAEYYDEAGGDDASDVVSDLDLEDLYGAAWTEQEAESMASAAASEAGAEEINANADEPSERVMPEGLGARRMAELREMWAYEDEHGAARARSHRGVDAGFVTKLLEGADRETPQAQEALRAEIRKMMDTYSAVRIDSPESWFDVKKRNPSATRIKLKAIISAKGEEISADDQSAQDQVQTKARVILQGCIVEDVQGRLVQPGDKLPVDTLRFSEMREMDAAGFLEGGADYAVSIADVESAYLQAESHDKNTYCYVTPEVMRALDDERKARIQNLMNEYGLKLGDIVYAVDGAVYGARESGFAFDQKRTECLEAVGWTRMRGRLHIYEKQTTEGRPAYLGAYVDDCRLVAPATAHKKLWAEIHARMPLKKGAGETTKCLGVETDVTHAFEFGQGVTFVTYSQAAYADYICKKAEELLKTKLYPISTPYVKQDPCEEWGRWGIEARSLVASAQYLCLGSRPDLAYAIQRMQVEASKWTVASDRALLRLYRYISGTTGYGLVNKFVDKEEHYERVVSADSDHAGCRESKRSTTGAVMWLNGEKGSKATIQWLCKRQGCVTLSSAEAESVAMTVAIRRMALPSKMQGLLPEDVLTVVESDAEAVVKIMRAGGESRALQHLNHTAGVSTAWTAEVLRGPGFALRQVPTTRMAADMMTKGLGRASFEAGCARLGVGQAVACGAVDFLGFKQKTWRHDAKYKSFQKMKKTDGGRAGYLKALAAGRF